MRLAARAVLLSLAALALAWGVFRFYEALPEAALRSVASDIAAGESFKDETLADLEPKIAAAESEPIPNPDVLRSIAIIRLREAEAAIGSGQSPSKSQAFARAEAAARNALAHAPTDSFLWYAMAWMAKNRSGYGPDVARDLALSYQTGPHEGWVAVHRNGFALAMLAVLPPALQKDATAEFRNLVASNFINDAASILTGPGWPVHQQLLDDLRPVSETIRAQLAHRIADLGFDVSVPGVERLAPRPWK